MFGIDPTATVIGLILTLGPILITLVLAYFVIRAAVAPGIALAAKRGDMPDRRV